MGLKKSLRTLKKPDEESPAGWPARSRSIIVRKHEFSTPLVIGDNQYCDHDDDHRCDSPVHADLVQLVQKFRSSKIKENANDCQGPEGEYRLPCCGYVVFIPECNRTEQDLCSREVDAQSCGPVAYQAEPTINPAN